ncbi:receptor-like protein kinase FERONIA [Vigna unguiculata]|uniref:receptor-like protein kinase FERONIA n=1 Tax=Vigna unguiculata TaxID=3917 RepID=UPI001016EEC3|nr:receptor-like protein kinase FERONIA [Vigna unguiculata]
METTTKPIALGTILLLLLLSFSHLSKADVIFDPPDLLTINCGSSTNFSTPEGRNWIGDTNTKLLAVSRGSLIATAVTKTTIQGPYDSARLSFSNFTYSTFNLTAGPKFLRLFFFSTSYNNNFNRSKAVFSVKAGPYTLLQHFNASLNADADDDPARSNILFREYCINLQEGQNLNITFIPSSTGSYAFINGIEIVSMPSYLYYTDPNVDIGGLPKLVGGQTYTIENNLALEMKYRLRFGDRSIPASEDTGMLRTWDVHNQYITTQSVESLDFGNKTKLIFSKTPNYTAPDQVYLSLVNMGPNASINMGFNLTWQLPVDPGFTYMLRLHFCQLDPEVIGSGDQIFLIYIRDDLVEDFVDIFSWGGKQRGVPVVRDYAVIINASDNQKKTYLSVKLHPHDKSLIKDAQLNAIELFKISDPTGNLAVPGSDPPPQTVQISKNKNNSTTRIPAAVAGAVSGVLLFSFIVAFFLIKRRKSVSVSKCPNKKDGTSLGSGSSSLPTHLCRHFSVAEIRAATNNFDEQMVVGVGGFGNVYKGYIDDGSTCVAVKRLKRGSRQGINEFMNEIEMLSQLRHLHLVSLIGYCYENNEMILVYDFMERGTLRDHLYGADNQSLPWEQRVEICIGVARGLHYLHTGVKQVIIHRDVKTTNILLDEKWMAKVSDFGLSRIGPTGISMSHVNTQVKGSIGYLDPEYYKRQRLTEKSDVYSFGVVLLEVLCGRQPLIHWEEKQRISVVKWAKHCYEKGCLGEVVDPTVKGQTTAQCLQKFGEIALSCLQEDGTERPSMKDVVGMLQCVLQLHYSGVGEDVSGSGVFSQLDADYSNNTTSDGDSSWTRNESSVLIPDDVFSEIKDPKGR